MKTHKTWSGMVNAVENLIREIEANPPTEDREYRDYRKRADGLHAELNSLWTNPADVAEAARLKYRLSEAISAVV